MGWIYGRNPYTGRMNLACDICGGINHVRKHPCPFGYCQAYAVCPSCWAKIKPTWRQKHIANGCDVNHRDYMERKAREHALLEKGEYLRVAALSHGDMVKVIFRNKDGKETAYFMGHRTYDSIPLNKPATPDDYRRHGAITLARSVNISENR